LAKQSVSSVESPETTALANLHIRRHEAVQWTLQSNESRHVAAAPDQL
jgi:hypothetical protein